MTKPCPSNCVQLPEASNSWLGHLLAQVPDEPLLQQRLMALVNPDGERAGPAAAHPASP